MKLKIVGGLLIILFVGSLVMLFGGLAREYDVAVERDRRAAKADGDIIIGVAWPLGLEGIMLQEGIKMAVDEINAGGGVLNRRIEILWKDDEASISQGRVVAQQFADNPDVVAVIGHLHSYVSIPASRIYKFSGLLMLSPISTAPKLTRQGFERIFRNIPSDEDFGRQIVDFAARQGYRRVVIYYVNDAYGRGLATAIERRAEELEIDVVDRLSYDGIDDREFRVALATWEPLEFDAIFLAGSLPAAARFIKEARGAGVTVPIIGGDGLDSPELWEVAGDAAEGTIVASVFHNDVPRPEVQNFNRDFRTKYGVLPDVFAAQGYDAMRLIAYAMEKAGTTAPGKVAEALHSVKDWPGVTGLHTFDAKGDVVGKPIIKMVVRDGRFEYLEWESPQR